MKTMINGLMVLVLCCTFAFADGDMGAGGIVGPCSVNCPPPPDCTEDCGDDSTNSSAAASQSESDLTVLLVQEYLNTMF